MSTDRKKPIGPVLAAGKQPQKYPLHHPHHQPHKPTQSQQQQQQVQKQQPQEMQSLQQLTQQQQQTNEQQSNKSLRLPKPNVPNISRLQLQVSLLGDHAVVNETSYDDMYIEDGWKQTVFRRYRQAEGISPLVFLRQYHQVLVLQQLRHRILSELKARQLFNECVYGMHKRVSQSPDAERAAKVLDKVQEAMRWLEKRPPNKLERRVEYTRRQKELEQAYLEAFRQPFSLEDRS